jgi:DNA-binding IclR family transcriptional regulator
VAGSPVAAISISGPTTRFDSGSLAEASSALIKAVTAIRAELGYAR